MHALLIVGGSLDTRTLYLDKLLTSWRVAPFDQVELQAEGESIGVSQVREFQKQLILKPYQSDLLVGVIREADRLTVEAQNALLKTLEEPSGHVRIVCLAQNPLQLLPTLQSRCERTDLPAIVPYTQEEVASFFKTLGTLAAANTGEKLKALSTIASTREAAKAWLELAIFSVRELLIAPYMTKTGRVDKTALYGMKASRLLRMLVSAQSQLGANVTPTLVLDSVFLSL